MAVGGAVQPVGPRQIWMGLGRMFAEEQCEDDLAHAASCADQRTGMFEELEDLKGVSGEAFTSIFQPPI
jgi:hypothetical protein